MTRVTGWNILALQTERTTESANAPKRRNGRSNVLTSPNQPVPSKE